MANSNVSHLYKYNEDRGIPVPILSNA